jgi:large subunit ribosomal protein L20
MPRARAGAARHRRKVRLFKEAKGYRGARGSRLRAAKEAVLRAGVFAYRDRRARKREFRRLWIIRVAAASKARGIPYSRFVYGLQAAGIVLNRKMLSEIAIADPVAFDTIADLAKNNVPAQVA